MDRNRSEKKRKRRKIIETFNDVKKELKNKKDFLLNDTRKGTAK